MIIAISPDVFALPDAATKILADWIFSRRKDYKFAFDKKRALDKAYAEMLQTQLSHLDTDAHTSAAKLLQYLIVEIRDDVLRYPSHLTYSVQSLLDHPGCQCNDPLEQILIGMAAHVPKLGLRVLLPENAAHPCHRLFDPDCRARLVKEIPKLKVVFANDAEPYYPALIETPDKSDADRLFESKVESIIRDCFGCPRCYPKTPKIVEDAEGSGEIDVYGYMVDENGNRQIWIAECKHHENPDKLVDEENVTKFFNKKLGAVLEYEGGKCTRVSEINVFVVSNAVDMVPEFWKRAGEIQQKIDIDIPNDTRIRVRYLRTVISEGGNWRIHTVEEYEPISKQETKDPEEAVWQGRLVQRILLYPHNW
ncbi:MAG: hypothetical protein KC418_18190 [Anaerolineales bacterium]|nr:hypothetical protein [Anaerolineales bacterium]MCB8954072.1 hypothetical protein [Ardenticatenales bacterium]